MMSTEPKSISGIPGAVASSANESDQSRIVRLHLTFPESLIKEPIVSKAVLDFGVLVNVRRANIDENVGWMLCEVQGSVEKIDEAIEWMAGLGVEVDRLGDVVES